MTTGPDLTMAGIKMVLVLLILLGALVGALYAVRRVSGGRHFGGRPIQVLATTYLGPGRAVSLVEIPGKVLVLGVTKNDIRVLDRIEDPDVMDGFRAADGPEAPSAFSDHLKRLTAGLGKRR